MKPTFDDVKELVELSLAVKKGIKDLSTRPAFADIEWELNLLTLGSSALFHVAVKFLDTDLVKR